MNHNVNGAHRFWGKLTPPKSKTEFFDAITTPAPTGDGSIATIRLYGPIDSYGGWWGINAADVSEVLDGLPESVTQIILRINSPGGHVFEAVSILNMLRAHKASVLAVVDGLAASAGSVIAVGCDEVVMSPGTQMMIHSPSTIVWGNAAEMRKEADVLDSVEESIISIYRDKAGESAWGELLAAETWYTAQQAVEAGLADRVGVVKDAGDTSTAGADEEEDAVPLEGDDVEDIYQSARAHLGLTPIGATAPNRLPDSSEPGATNEKEALTMSDTIKAGLRERLGITDADLSDEQYLSAVDEALTEQADTQAAPAAASASTTPEGAVLIDAAALATLQSNAAAGVEALQTQTSARRDGIVDTAMREGRIAPASSATWRKALDENEESTTALLATFPKNTIPVDAVGHSDDVLDADSALYGNVYPSTEKES